MLKQSQHRQVKTDGEQNDRFVSLSHRTHKQEQDHKAQPRLKSIQAEVWLKPQRTGLEKEERHAGDFSMSSGYN